MPMHCPLFWGMGRHWRCNRCRLGARHVVQAEHRGEGGMLPAESIHLLLQHRVLSLQRAVAPCSPTHLAGTPHSKPGRGDPVVADIWGRGGSVLGQLRGRRRGEAVEGAGL